MTSEAAGAITGAPGRTGSLIYFGVEDLDDAIAQARELGGTCGERQEIPGVGFFVECTDTEGNTIALWEAIG